MTEMKKRNSGYNYLVLAAFAAVGLGVGVVRLINGLGATTNLSDAYPWGLWIVYDVFVIPFSAGAFMISLVAHIYDREEFHDIARPVVWAGFAGYTGVVAILLMDLGRWHQFYSILLPPRWNLHSFMFEVSMCITLYSMVLVLEIAPAFLERLDWQIPLRFINSVAALVAGTGIVLSSLHQSSLGSLFLLMPYKLHPLWWTPLLPLMFFTSAAFSGLSMAILVTTISRRVFGWRIKLEPLGKLARVVSIMIGVYLALKVGDLVFAGEVALVFSSGGASALFLAEIAIGVITPLVLFGLRQVRERPTGLLAGSACVLLGLALNRMDVAFLALEAPAAATYFPHWMEIFLSVAVVAVGVLVYALAVRFLPVMSHGGAVTDSSVWSRRGLIMSGIGLFALTVIVILILQPVARAATPVSALLSAGSVNTFAMSQSENCAACHLDEAALARAGAGEDELSRLVVDRPPESAHIGVGCVTCHWGDGGAAEVDAAHASVIPDPTRGDFEACRECHHDMPDVFPGDRLRTPHNDVVHGHEVDMHCSDCHGGVAHGIDPMSSELICPMDVCLDCHQELGLESEFEHCSVCHTGPHDTDIECEMCHQSAEVWEEVAFAAHPVPLEGNHAAAWCFDCHQQPEFEGLRFVCADCHVRTHEFGDDECAKCHTPADDWGTCGATGIHPFPLDHGDTNCNCVKCHQGGDTSDYWCGICHREGDMEELHAAQDIHFTTGLCAICHPEGQVQ